MTDVLITVDTELSSSLQRKGVSLLDNFNKSILGLCSDGDFGMLYQMRRLNECAEKGVYFVDPMPALVHGEQVIADIVGPILEHGHEVQLHLHTEWLEWATHSPVDGRQGRDVADFSLDDQIALLRYGTEVLNRAGADELTAFRAGNYGANDDTIVALAELGYIWDTSFHPGFTHRNSFIDLPVNQVSPARLGPVVELPVACIHDRPGRVRPVQICALSAREMRSALRHAARNAHPVCVVVNHSFELLTRDRTRANRLLVDRYDSTVRGIAAHAELNTAFFADLDQAYLSNTHQPLTRLAPDLFRTGLRMVEQALSNLRYEGRIRV